MSLKTRIIIFVVAVVVLIPVGFAIDFAYTRWLVRGQTEQIVREAAELNQETLTVPSWRDDPNATLVCDTNDFIFWEMPPTHCYTFDVNTDPMVIGKMFHRWMRANPEEWSQFILCVPVEDKAEYDAIFAGKGKN